VCLCGFCLCVCVGFVCVFVWVLFVCLCGFCLCVCVGVLVIFILYSD